MRPQEALDPLTSLQASNPTSRSLIRKGSKSATSGALGPAQWPSNQLSRNGNLSDTVSPHAYLGAIEQCIRRALSGERPNAEGPTDMRSSPLQSDRPIAAPEAPFACRPDAGSRSGASCGLTRTKRRSATSIPQLAFPTSIGTTAMSYRAWYSSAARQPSPP
jgi:hypothetical protein